MTQGSSDASPSVRDQTDRLIGWLQIAAYLQKSVRTVQRWERDYRLPVHRDGDAGAPPWASRGELERWIRGGRFASSEPEQPSREGLLVAAESTAESIDERIARLGEVQHGLEEALQAVRELEAQAKRHQTEVLELQRKIENLGQDRKAAEALLSVPEHAFARLWARTASRGRWRGTVEGLVVGFVSGFLSSLIVWYITTR